MKLVRDEHNLYILYSQQNGCEITNTFDFNLLCACVFIKSTKNSFHFVQTFLFILYNLSKFHLICKYLITTDLIDYTRLTHRFHLKFVSKR